VKLEKSYQARNNLRRRDGGWTLGGFLDDNCVGEVHHAALGRKCRGNRGGGGKRLGGQTHREGQKEGTQLFQESCPIHVRNNQEVQRKKEGQWVTLLSKKNLRFFGWRIRSIAKKKKGTEGKNNYQKKKGIALCGTTNLPRERGDASDGKPDTNRGEAEYDANSGSVAKVPLNITPRRKKGKGGQG